MTSPRLPPSDHRMDSGRSVLSPGVLTGVAVVAGWVGIWLAWQQRWAGVVCAIAAMALAVLAVWRGRVLGRSRNVSLRRALEAAAERNDQLEALRHLSQVLLSGKALPELLTEVCRFAADLVGGQAACIGLVVEEGRFIKIVAATGAMEHALHRVVPTDRSLAGWVVSNDEAILVADMSTDQRSFQFPEAPRELRSTAMTPLRAGGLAIGVVSVFDRKDGTP